MKFRKYTEKVCLIVIDFYDGILSCIVSLVLFYQYFLSSLALCCYRMPLYQLSASITSLVFYQLIVSLFLLQRFRKILNAENKYYKRQLFLDIIYIKRNPNSINFKTDINYPSPNIFLIFFSSSVFYKNVSVKISKQ